MVIETMFTYVRWTKSLLALQLMHLFGSAADTLSARRSVVLARMQMVFEQTRAEALKSLKKFRNR